MPGRRLPGWLVRLLVAAVALLAPLLLASGQAGAVDDEAGSNYQLSTGDKIRITVYGHADLSGDFEIDGAGRLSLPLIRTVEAAGLTARELEAGITARLKPDYLRDPQVSIEILSYRPIYVIGEVQAPGSYPYASGMTAINAVALAGGYTYRARKNTVRIIRGANEQQQKISADPDTVIMPGDVIEVPERFF